MKRHMMLTMGFAILFSLVACTRASTHPSTLAPMPPKSASTWSEIVLPQGPLQLESVISARWAVNLKGLVNLDHPKAKEAGLVNKKVPIVLPVHILTHPEKGTFVVDTGVTEDRANGGQGAVRGLVRSFVKEIEVVESLQSMLERQQNPLAAVFLTHTHIDHVLGIPDVPIDTPIYAGPDEFAPRSFQNRFLKRTYRKIFEDRGPILAFDYKNGVDLGDGLWALDVWGDGSFWAIHAPGHTPGSTVYLANTVEGPVLLLGDTSHTKWGWDNGVEPGTFTLDQETHAKTLNALKKLVKTTPELQVYMGHDLPGENTGVTSAQTLQ